MDIAGLSMSMASNNLQTKIGTAVLSKAMDTNEALGQGIVQMIDSAAMERSVTRNLVRISICGFSAEIIHNKR